MACTVIHPRRVDATASGFTLIELIVVIALISIMLFFALPRLSSDVLDDDLNAASRWIILKVRALKDQARQEQQRYVLHIDMSTERLWISNAAMTNEERAQAAEDAYRLPEDVKVLDVEYPAAERIASGEAQIWFFENGYSQKALIHLGNQAGDVRSFLIEPFLPSVILFTETVGFES